MDINTYVRTTRPIYSVNFSPIKKGVQGVILTKTPSILGSDRFLYLVSFDDGRDALCFSAELEEVSC